MKIADQQIKDLVDKLKIDVNKLMSDMHEKNSCQDEIEFALRLHYDLNVLYTNGNTQRVILQNIKNIHNTAFLLECGISMFKERSEEIKDKANSYITYMKLMNFED